MPQRPPVQPRIGLTLDAEPPGGYSKLPWYAIRANYCEAVVRAGGVPIALPHEVELVDAYLDLLDGLLVTGGAFDLDPLLYGASERHATVRTKDRRTAFEMAITKGALQRDRPLRALSPATASRLWPAAGCTRSAASCVSRSTPRIIRRPARSVLAWRSAGARRTA